MLQRGGGEGGRVSSNSSNLSHFVVLSSSRVHWQERGGDPVLQRTDNSSGVAPRSDGWKRLPPPLTSLAWFIAPLQPLSPPPPLSVKHALGSRTTAGVKTSSNSAKVRLTMLALYQTEKRGLIQNTWASFSDSREALGEFRGPHFKDNQGFQG